MRNNLLIAAAFTALGVFAFAQNAEDSIVGKDAPAFELKGTDGKTHTLKSLTAEAPVFVLFWKERCPHNPRAAKLFNELNKAYAPKAKLIGVVNASPEGSLAWQRQFACEYVFLSDADKATIKNYKMKASIVTVLIGKDGKVQKFFGGYGKEALEQLNASMAEVAGVPAANVDLSSAPANTTYG